MDDEAPWRRHFPDSCRWDEPIERIAIPELLARGVAEARGPILQFRDRTIAYPAFAAGVERLAAGLITLGLVPGTRVALLLPNTPLHPLAFFAAARAGLVVVHLSALDPPRVLAHKLALTRARVLLTTDLPGFLPEALGLLDAGAIDHVLVGADALWGEDAETVTVPQRPGVFRLADLAAPPPDCWPIPAPDALMLLQFTGGTTGLPKAAMLTHGNLTAAAAMYRLWRDTAEEREASARTLCALPLFHIFALTAVLLRCVRGGHTILLQQRFDPAAVVAEMAAARVTALPGVPTMWTALAAEPGFTPEAVASLRSGTSGGAPTPPALMERVRVASGLRLAVGWGMTETGPAGTRLPAAAPLRPGVIGIPLPGLHMRIVDPDDPGRPLPPGRAGEIAIRGPNVFAGYLGRPEETRAAFRDGWFLTGDIGRMDETGVFDLIDRRRNVILSGGFNLYPAQIEAAIAEHPDVAEVVVVGVPDPYRGEAAKAFVALRPGAAPFDLRALRAFLADRIGRHERPRALEFRPALPRSPAGKILARVLAKEAADPPASQQAEADEFAP